MQRLIAIDPGLKRCGFTVFHERDLFFCIESTPKECLEMLYQHLEGDDVTKFKVVIEKPVAMRFSGAEITETAIFAGIAGGFALLHPNKPVDVYFVTRSKVRGHFLKGESRKNGDSQIRKAMLDIYGKVTTGDGWQSLALGHMAVNNPLKIQPYLFTMLGGVAE